MANQITESTDLMAALAAAETLLKKHGAYLIHDDGDFCLVYHSGYSGNKAAEHIPGTNRPEVVVLAARFLELTLADEKKNVPSPSDIRRQLQAATDEPQPQQ